jgi:DNA-binding MarR family transcriptional regulator|tara:strand:- start:192 stop:641 length:450 start_codon:yes stop_codon:yes gene_type:complete
MARKRTQRSLGVFADLVKAIDWYDLSLQSILESRGMWSMNRTQSIMMIHIAEGIIRPSDIAHEMGVSRQNIHAMAKPLLENRIIELVPNPDDGRSKQYVFCEDSQELRDTVIELLRFLDEKLGARIGKAEVRSLKRVLAMDWGEVISEH